MNDRKQVARWRRTPRETGLRAVVQKRGYQLRLGTKVLITVGWAQSFGDYGSSGWIWYGMGKNDCYTKYKTAEDAKTAADAWYKANRVSDTGEGND